MPEAPLISSGSGKAPGGPGWYVLNAAEAAWWRIPGRGAVTDFQGHEGANRLGVELQAIAPGEVAYAYHATAAQVDVLVLQGECLLLVEEQERTLGPWDVAHLPPQVAHALIGAGDTHCLAVVLVARAHEDTIQPRPSPLAERHGADLTHAQTTGSPEGVRCPALDLDPGLARPARPAPATPGRGEATLGPAGQGQAPTNAGWFVLDARDARWRENASFGCSGRVEGEGEARFHQLGFNLSRLEPGRSNCRYHREALEEGFLVLHGEATLLVEEQERPLRAWDYVHCAPGTDHVLVGAGSGPCLILALGERAEDQGLLYPRSELAARYNASAAASTPNPARPTPPTRRPRTFPARLPSRSPPSSRPRPGGSWRSSSTPSPTSGGSSSLLPVCASLPPHGARKGSRTADKANLQHALPIS
ncbi:MAG: cupin domain-containing protein [Planctomycetota bacterium]